jgi:hypothetical protein
MLGDKMKEKIMRERIINFLLKNANPSIKYRVKKEVLNEDISVEEKKELQAQIMEESNIQLIIHCQKENGWLGNGFHGPNKDAGPYENQEVGTKYLGEKLIFKDTPVLQRAMNAFITTELTDLCYRTKGKLFDEFKYAANGQNIIRCACIARAGYEDIIDIKPQVQLSIDSFKRVLEVDSILDVTRTIKNGSKQKRVFNNNEKWPCYYHLDILAHTSSWMTDKNIKTLAESVKKLMRTDRPEMQIAADSWVGYVLGTTGCFKEGFQIGYENQGVHYTILDRMEWLCRCGIASYINELKNEIEIIAKSINKDGVCKANIDENQLKGFSTYGGQQLEVDWKMPIRRLCDITFRALLILHYSKYI